VRAGKQQWWLRVGSLLFCGRRWPAARVAQAPQGLAAWAARHSRVALEDKGMPLEPPKVEVGAAAEDRSVRLARAEAWLMGACAAGWSARPTSFVAGPLLAVFVRSKDLIFRRHVVEGKNEITRSRADGCGDTVALFEQRVPLGLGGGRRAFAGSIV
jgi:hypothetical protein